MDAALVISNSYDKRRYFLENPESENNNTAWKELHSEPAGIGNGGRGGGSSWRVGGNGGSEERLLFRP